MNTEVQQEPKKPSLKLLEFKSSEHKVIEEMLKDLLEESANISGLATIIFYKNDDAIAYTSDLAANDYAMACKIMDEDFRMRCFSEE
jgi:hypothetical protein